MPGSEENDLSIVARPILAALAGLAAVALAAAAFVWSGLYDVGADDAHTRPVHATLDALRLHSIARRARGIALPGDLGDAARIRAGAGNYAAMCAACHLAPGVAESELHRGLYPAPPVLWRQPAGDPRAQFWIAKHGIKASGMPAWGRSMDDAALWSVVAFLQQLPRLDAARYHALVASSGGHTHGAGEAAHGHDDVMEGMHGMSGRHAMAPDDQHAADEAMPHDHHHAADEATPRDGHEGHADAPPPGG
jgi:mono/diheme cytochrome c family protein